MAVSRYAPRLGPHSRILTVLLALLIIWFPVQTPVAIVAFQYLHVSAQGARLVLLIKDAAVAAIIVALALRYWRSLRWQWFDIAALVYVVTVVVYTVVPLVTGTSGFTGVVASARQLLVPPELYALGRLALPAGADRDLLVRVSITTAAVAAVLTVGQYVFGSPTFYATTLDLVSFERSVQGFTNAANLWNISILGDYGTGQGTYARAVGPFTHPVGTAHYFVFPLALATIAAFKMRGRARLVFAVLALLFAMVIVATVSRGTWIAAVLAVLVAGVAVRRLRYSVLAVLLAVLFVAFVPPYNASIASALNGSDSSTGGHAAAISRGIDQLAQHPLGAGVGQADKFASVQIEGATQQVTQAEDLGVGENTFLSIAVNAGPLAVFAFTLLLLGIVGNALPFRPLDPGAWPCAALAAATIGYAASAMTSSPLMRFTTSATYWFLAGLLVTAGGINGRGAWRSVLSAAPRRLMSRTSAR